MIGAEGTRVNQPDWIITKRQLGRLFIGVGAAGFVGLLGLDLIRGRAGDLGPSQSLGLAACLALALIGLSLLPLGNRPA